MLEDTASSSLDSTMHGHLRSISDATTRLQKMIDDLLSFSRVGIALARSRVDLNQVVTVAQHQVTLGLSGRDVVWRVDKLPTVEGDASLLQLVFVNLLSNALKYSARCPRSAIEVGTISSDGADHIVFVRDNGVGFDMKYADRLFGVFQRLHRADEFEGTGIGLANVRRIVERHGGRTWAEGALDCGATFYVALPMDAEKHARGQA